MRLEMSQSSTTVASHAFSSIFCISFYYSFPLPSFWPCYLPCRERHPQIWGRSLWEQYSEPKCCQLLWVPVLFCVLPASSLCKLPCRTKATHWWRHCCIEGSGVVWSLGSELLLPRASVKQIWATSPIHVAFYFFTLVFFYFNSARKIVYSTDLVNNPHENQRVIFVRWQ